jgi:hypothetical protein
MNLWRQSLAKRKMQMRYFIAYQVLRFEVRRIRRREHPTLANGYIYRLITRFCDRSGQYAVKDRFAESVFRIWRQVHYSRRRDQWRAECRLDDRTIRALRQFPT